MGNVQPNYNATLDRGYEGQIADMRLSDVISRVCEPASIGFGLAVIRGTADNQVKLGAAGEFIGLTVRDITLPAANEDVYKAGNTIGLMVKGTMFCKAIAAVSAGDPVYRTATGTLTGNVKGTRTATFGTQVGNGDGTLPSITVDATNPPDIGGYQLRFVEAASNLGYFEVIKLDSLGGNVGVIGTGKVGVAFNNGGLSFTIPDGSTDWALNTTVVITVAGGNTIIPGARWLDTLAQDAIGRVRLD